MSMPKKTFYRPLIESLDDECEFNPPAAFFEILDVEETLGVTLPDELKDFLRESNGVRYDYGAGLVWSTKDIKRIKLEFRSDPGYKEFYMPFDSLLFFGDYGNGDQAAYYITGGELRRPDIFEWNHEEASRINLTFGLKRYI